MNSKPMFTEKTRMGNRPPLSRPQRILGALGLCALAPGLAAAASIYVPEDQPTVQAGIDAASTGDSIVVAPGIYLESIDFLGKVVVVTSTDPADSAVVASTVLDAGGAQRVVTFQNAETRASVLTGFTITGGSASTGGGIACVGASPSLMHCVIQDNFGTTKGGGLQLRDSSALVQDLHIHANVTDGDGGGVHIDGGAPEFVGVIIEDNKADDDAGGVRVGGGASALFDECTVANNSAEDGGGGFDLRDSATILTGCKVTGNGALNIGGGVFCSGGEVQLSGSILAANHARLDGAGITLVASADAQLQHCTLIANVADRSGGGAHVSGGATIDIGSSVLWQNWPDQMVAEPGAASIRYSDVQDGWDGQGNIDTDPIFCGGACARHDASLAANSPCLGTGEAGSDMGHAGMGCDQPQNHLPQVLAIPSDMSSLTQAIRMACDGDTLLLSTGTYDEGETIVVDHPLYITSTAPEDTAVVAQTVLSGDDHRVVFDFVGAGASGAKLVGITVTNGNSERGGGIACRDGASPFINRCRIVGNRGWDVGGVYCYNESNPTLFRCRISDNQGVEYAGGVGCENASPTLLLCTIDGNLAEADGGGGVGSVGLLSAPVVSHCVINSNISYNGGGLDFADSSSGLVLNCLVADNLTEGEDGGDGGGFRISDGSTPIIMNTTIVNNHAERGAGVRCNKSYPVFINDIFWNNDGQDEIHDEEVVTISISYSDVRGGWPGEGNIDADPHFGEWREFDYLLSFDSPCIDAGDPYFADAIYDASDVWPDLGPRNGLRSDMGAYGGLLNFVWLW
jgi:hypothetical protein